MLIKKWLSWIPSIDSAALDARNFPCNTSPCSIVTELYIVLWYLAFHNVLTLFDLLMSEVQDNLPHMFL